MTYNADLKWAELSQRAGTHANNLSIAVREALEQYNEWQNFRAGRTDVQLASALGRTESEIADLDSCYAAFKECHDFMDNVASPTQGDRMYALRKFS